MSRPLLSIVMPVYNVGKYVLETVEGLLGQSFTDFELIVVDDGSKDNSLNILKKFEVKRIKILSNNRNSA